MIDPNRSPISEQDAWSQLLDAACAPYRRAGRFAWHFARGKLARDPVFCYLLREGMIPPRSRVLDIGCGQGLLASLLLSASHAAAEPHMWPRAWAAPPFACRITGIELMQADVDRAKAALGDGASFVCGDMRKVGYPPSDVVVMLDVLHYIPVAEQDMVLARVRAALVGGGRLLLRVGDASQERSYAISQWVDRVVTRVRGHQAAPTYGRPVADWVQTLKRMGFEVAQQPMSEGTPFANVLLVAEMHASTEETIAMARRPSATKPATPR